MQDSLIGAISIAIARTVTIVLGGIALCASILGAIGFALVALYSFLVTDLGPAAAAFATSGVALAIPILVMVGVVAATRIWIRGELPSELPVFTSRSKSPDEAMAVNRALGWISDHPRTATLGALSFGVAMGAYPDLRKSVLEGVNTALAQTRVPAN
jgi:hypothetical protein